MALGLGPVVPHWHYSGTGVSGALGGFSVLWDVQLLEEAVSQNCSPKKPSICKDRSLSYFHLVLPGMAAGRKGSWLRSPSSAWVRSRDQQWVFTRRLTQNGSRRHSQTLCALRPGGGPGTLCSSNNLHTAQWREAGRDAVESVEN